MEEMVMQMSSAAGYSFTKLPGGLIRLDSTIDPEPYIQGTVEAVIQRLERLLRRTRSK